MNLPDHLKDLLAKLVSLYQTKGRAEFHLNQLSDGWHITYSGGPSFPVVFADLDDLSRNRLIRLEKNTGSNVYRGWPSERGIASVEGVFATRHEGNSPLSTPRETNSSSKPHLPLAVHTANAESERLTRSLLKGCRNLASNGHRLSFDVGKATEILRTCAAETFDKQAEYFVSLGKFRLEWLVEAANQTIAATLGLVNPLDLLVDSVPNIEKEVRRTVEGALQKWNGRGNAEKAAGDGLQNVSHSKPPANAPSRQEVEKYASEIFAAGLEERIDDNARKQNQALADARATNNSGAYLPALIQCKVARLRAEILILADAWVRAATEYDAALGRWAEDALERAAALMAAGTKSALVGELALHAARTRSSPSSLAGGLEIDRAMNRAVREAKLKLKQQRINVTRLLEREPKKLENPPSKQKTVSTARSEEDSTKKRGRPVVIPDERKRAAAECKAKRGTNRDAAKLLYDKQYPTSQEVKNVPSILRHFRAKANESSRAVENHRSLPNPNRNRG